MTWWWRAPLECDLVKRTISGSSKRTIEWNLLISAPILENQNPPLFHRAVLWQGFEKVCRQWIPSAPKICISTIFEVLVAAIIFFDQFLSLNLCLIGSSWHLQPNIIRYDDMTKLISMHSTFLSELISFLKSSTFLIASGL